jgi:hypothetical protein
MSATSPTATRLPSAQTELSTTSSSSPTLFNLAIQVQEVSGELALAAELLDSDDPEQQDTARGLVEHFLALDESARSALTTKADQVCHVIDALHGKADFRAKEADRLAALAKADQRRAEKLQTYLIDILLKLNPDNTRFSFPTHELVSRVSEAVDVVDEGLIPNDLLRETIKYAPDKTAIKAAIKAGTTVPGAELVKRRNWSIK